jgi:hypothetical protein
MRRLDNPIMRSLLTWWPVVAVALPIAVAAVRAAAGGWVPTGDDAYFTVRSRDVLTDHHPLVGAWSSGSLDLSTPINNLGPIQLDLLAPFTRWTPMGGTAIGVAVVQIAAIVGIGWLVARIAGRSAVAPTMFVVALLTWTMGSEMLITPRQHQYSIVPYLCLLVAAWAAARGDRWALVIAVAAGSLVAQTHLSYPVLVAALAVPVVAGQIASTVAGTTVGGRTPLLIACGLAAVLWSQSVVDQFAGFGNLGHVLSGSGDGGRVGLGGGTRIVAGVLVGPYTLLRPGYRHFDAAAPHADTWQVVVLAACVAGATIALAVAWRRVGWATVAGGVVGLVAVLAGVLDAALLPSTQFGIVIGNYRWLWATAAFVAIVAVVAPWQRLLPTMHTDRRRTVAVLAGVAVLAVPVVANLPRSVQSVGADRYRAEQVAVAELLTQLDLALDTNRVRGPVVVDDSAMYFGHGFTYPILIELQAHGVDFRFDDPIQERRFGSGRVSDGAEPQRLRLLADAAAIEARMSPDVIGFIASTPPVALVVVSN